ncbi:MAG: acetyl-CoA C-acyltransferase, partial [Rubrivivax sp.]|nr:acetyl-CoA C-acyltransferase [Rubrivivax sp.]
MGLAYIYDHVRTPRGKGKKDGSLHQASPVWLLRTLLQALQQRLLLDTALVDDVVLGCVTPVGEQGADLARTAVLDAEWSQTVAGVTQSRFCASGLESVNLAAAKVASGFEDLVVGGGVESMSR